MKYIYMMLFAIILNSSEAQSRPYTFAIIDNNVKFEIGYSISDSYKDIKYFSDGEKANFMNKSKNEVVTLDFCCGGNGEIQKILLANANSISKESPINNTNIKNFNLNSGIKLGAKKNEILNKFGNPDEIKTNNNETIFLYITDKNNSFLKKYNMPFYYEKYVFKKDILIICEFGFDYP